jgi:DNA-binding XRE family transcriptional regulator
LETCECICSHPAASLGLRLNGDGSLIHLDRFLLHLLSKTRNKSVTIDFKFWITNIIRENVGTRYSLVFLVSRFRHDHEMPVRKPKSCSYRKRFGKNIALLRKRRRVTQERLAEKVGTSTRYVQSVEAGEYFPSLPTLVHLKLALRCKWSEMFAGCDKA